MPNQHPTSGAGAGSSLAHPNDRWLLTGGMGFIGSRLQSALRRLGQDFAVLDNFLPQVHPQGLVRIDPEVRLYVGDLRDSDLVAACVADYRPTVVVHLAAETGTGQSLTQPVRHVGVNGLGTARLIEALYKETSSVRQVVLASSRAVYGEGCWRRSHGEAFYPKPRTYGAMAAGSFGVYDEHQEECEFLPHSARSTLPNPSSVYGATKLLQEHLLSSFSLNTSSSLAILRLQNVYGHGQSPSNPYTGIVTLFDQLSRRREPIPVYEDGQAVRDFVHVTDVVDAILAAVARGLDDTVDIGSGVPTKLIDLAVRIATSHNAPQPVITGQFRLGDVRSAVVDLTRSRELLGLTPKVSLDDGLREITNGELYGL